jgi:GNAT superfamily N-acetyltransferase
MTTFRPAIATDEAFLLALTDRLASFPVPSWRTAAEIAAADHPILLEALRRPGPESLILIAEDPVGTPSGYVFVTTDVDYFTQQSHAHIEIVAVLPEAVGQGIGGALLARAEQWARQRGYRTITLNVFERNRAARAVYEHLGYQPETIHYRKGLEPRPDADPNR